MFLRSVALVIAMALAMLSNQAETAAAGKTGARVVVLVSHNAEPYEDALEGFRSYFASKGVEVFIEVYQLNGDASGAAQALEKARKENANLILALGSLATSAACGEAVGIPVVAGLIMNVEEIKARSNFAAVLLDFPLEVQLKWIGKLLPGCKNLGILYNPARMTLKVEAATQIAQGMGVKIIAQKVESPSELPAALESLSRKVDALWGLADDLVYTPQTAKEILLFSFRNKVPLIGISREWVKAGALCAIESDYRDLGAQCGEKALKALQSAMSDFYAPEYPRKVVYSINLKTAQHMKVEIRDTWIQGAQQVFR
ncbi:MAG: ABC transporter substrate binding protein [Syntrophobacter sp.]